MDDDGFIKERLPNSTGVLVCGILSIVFCCCYGIGFVFGALAVYLANQGMKEYNANPSAYTLGSYNNLKAGRVCGLIGLIGSAMMVALMIIGKINDFVSWADFEQFLTI